MKRIRTARMATQILFVILTIAAIGMELPAFKIAVLLTTLTGGVFYCGWACSFGFIQDIGSKIGRKFGVRQRQVPDNIHRVAIYMRYILAVATVAITSDFIMIVMQIEARGAFLGLLSGRLPMVAALSSIVFFFAVSIKYDRVYCRYVCPEGGRYGLMSLVRPLSIKRDEETCVNCGKCDKACPMQIRVSGADKLRSPQCINCFECVGTCPVDGVLNYGLVFTKNKKVS